MLLISLAHADVSVASDAARVASDGDRAVSEIEKMTEYHDSSVGDGGDPGDTWLALERIVKLGVEATPRLARLAESRSPVARMAAARGFGLVRSQEGNRILRQLLRDQAKPMACLSGCVCGHTAVNVVAFGALGQYPLDELLRPGDEASVVRVEKTQFPSAEISLLREIAGHSAKKSSWRLDWAPFHGTEVFEGDRAIALSSEGIQLRSLVAWTERKEKLVKRALSTSGRSKPPAP